MTTHEPTFQHVLGAVLAELTPQPWGFTDSTGATLTVTPAGIPEEAGSAEVVIRVTAGHPRAAEIGITTTDLPGLIDALTKRTACSHETTLHDTLTLKFGAGGAIELTVTEFDWSSASNDENTATVHLPAEQRLPLASALSRANDVARGWEDEPDGGEA